MNNKEKRTMPDTPVVKLGEINRTHIRIGKKGAALLRYFLTVFTGEHLQPDVYRVYLHELPSCGDSWKVTELQPQYSRESVDAYVLNYPYGEGSYATGEQNYV